MNTMSIAGKEALSLVQVLCRQAENRFHKPAFRFLADGTGGESTLTFGELDRQARQIAAQLKKVCAPGDRVLLLHPQSLEIVSAFFGCLYAGVVAVPAYHPKNNYHRQRLQAIVEDAGARVALTRPAELEKVRAAFAGQRGLDQVLCLAAPSSQLELLEEPFAAGPETIAFLQYTSGSTGKPKGVMVSHGNLLHNLATMEEQYGCGPDDVSVNWMPFFHDFGLIFGFLQPVYGGFTNVFLTPASVVQNPLRWLEAISRHRARLTAAPNFAYDLCVAKISPEERLGLDLSCWEVCANGAEPIRQDTLRSFQAAFGPCGFKDTVFYNVWGMAEATLVGSCGVRGTQSRFVSLDREKLKAGLVVPVPEGSPHSQVLVGCGAALPGQECRIVDPATLKECPPDRVGELWLSGPSVAKGYWNQPLASRESFQARLEGGGEREFLRTGDLAFFWKDDLYLCGRHKDLVIIRGQNYYPQDLEWSVEKSHPALRPGHGAAFSVEEDGVEKLVVVHELERHQEKCSEEVFAAVRQALSQEHELQVQAIVLVRHGSIPRTSSGKIQRRACRQGFLDATLEVLAAWSQKTVNQAKAGPVPSAYSSMTPGKAALWLLSVLAVRLKREIFELDADTPLTAYGLDSLAALELAHEIRQKLRLDFPVSALLEGATAAELGGRISLLQKSPPISSGPEAGVEPEEAPCSLNQRALWLEHSLSPQSAGYNLAKAFLWKGPVEIPVLKQAFQLLVRRHAVLGHRFFSMEGEAFQKLGSEPVLDMEIEACGQWTEGRVQACLQDESARPFDLENRPPFRVRVYRRSETEQIILLCAHHIVFDFWSFPILLTDLARLYRAVSSGRVEPASEAPPYWKFAASQAARLNSTAGEAGWTYWKEKLGGPLPVLELPSDRPRSASTQGRTFTSSLILDPDLGRLLKRLARDQGATLHMLGLAAFQAFLHRTTGQEDILTGYPSSGRGDSAWSGTVGYFVNPLVHRASFAGDPTFRQLLRQVRAAGLEEMEHQDFPFSVLLERLKLKREPGCPALVQAMFVFQKSQSGFAEGMTEFILERGARLELEGLNLQSLDSPQQAGGYDLVLSAMEKEGSLAFQLQGNAGLFDASTVSRFMRSFEILLRSVAEGPDTPISILPLLDQKDRQKVLATWNQTFQPGPLEPAIHRLFEQRAEGQPEADALSFEGTVLSYGALNGRANHWAHALKRRGILPGTLVGLCFERGPGAVAAMLGILKQGCAYLPLDPTYPSDRLAFMIEDASLACVLTQASCRGLLPAACQGRVCVEEDAGLELEPVFNPPLKAAAGDLAYVIYTSGSTGKPKGALVEHGGLCSLAGFTRRTLDLRPSDRVLQFASLCFDASVWEIFSCLTAGACLVLARKETLASPGDLHALLGRESVSVALLPPALLAALDSDGLPGLRALVSGGESCSRELALRWSRGREFFNAYGPTEATVITTWHHFSESDPPSQPPIGKPIDNARVYVLDGRLQPVPLGQPGELFIGGAGVARGYLARPALTAEKFVPNPFSAGDGPLYRTGDLVKQGPEGVLEFIGRLDGQVKIRGFRIELGEVETCLGRQPGVRQAVVVAREDQPGNRRLVAYVLPVQDGPGLESWKLGLRRELPDYMQPSILVRVESFTLTASGKVDRRALPLPEASGQDETAGPVTPDESILAGLWKQVLGVDCPGLQVNFFELGGHSLLAAQLLSRVKETFGRGLSMAEFFEEPTLRGMAARLKAGACPSDWPQLEPGRGGTTVSFAQQRLWFMDRLVPGTPLYNIPLALRLDGKLSTDLLREALAEIVGRHEALRSNFEEVDGMPRLKVWPESRLEFRTVPVAGPRDWQEEACRPFDLARESLIRATLYEFAPERHLLLIVLHHIVADGWSLGLFQEELARIYEASCRGHKVLLPALPIQYPDYALWQRQAAAEGRMESQASYWKSKLAGLPALLELPLDRPRPAAQSFRGELLRFEWGAALGQAIHEFCRQEGVTPFMTLMAGFQALLARVTGQEDFAVGTAVAGRTLAQSERLIGFFVNMLVFRADLSGQPDFRALVRRVRDNSLEAFANQDLPFERLVEELHPLRSLSFHPLFQVLFVMQNSPASAFQLDGLEVESLDLPSRCAKFDLTLSVEAQGRGFRGSLEFSSDLFERETAEMLLDSLEVLLEAATRQPQSVWQNLPLLGEATLRRLTAGEAAVPPAGSIQQRFESQAGIQPESAALWQDGKEMTYGELNRRANVMAWSLIEKGLRPDELVGLCLPRSFDMVVALLGILKAGGAYLPLDPAYPQERLEFMLKDAAARFVLAAPGQDKIREWPGITAVEVPSVPGRNDQDKGNPSCRVTPENLAYVNFTSGSTGRPKGVLIPHRGVLRLIDGLPFLKLGSSSRILQMAPLSFDAATFEIWAALCHGGLCVLYPEGPFETGKLQSCLESGRVGTAWLTSALFNTVMDERPSALKGLGQLLIGGEALSTTHVHKALALLKGTLLVNGYGPTECTTFTCCYPIPAGLDPALPVPIGKPVGNTQVYVLDAAMRLVPPGVTGELHVAGAGLARGYLNRPDLSAEKFVPNPFGAGRLYKTGDMVRLLPGGDLGFLGRRDQQVKIRGYRIELEEIEALLASHPAVSRCVVLCREDQPGQKQLVAYVAAGPGAALEFPDLKAFLKKRLPDYMLPSAYVLLDSIPMTPHGKVDRQALPGPHSRPSISSGAPAAPRDSMELLLLKIWQDLLGTAHFGVRDDFFELGGHSLMAVRLMARIHAETGRDLPLSVLMQGGTIEHLASLLQGQENGGPVSPMLGLKTGGSRTPFFCVHAVGGSAVCFAGLARHWDPERPLYVFQSPGLDGRGERLGRVEAMAEAYFQEILKIQPHGPYLLGGWCGGGLVAYEMAHLARARGEEVARILLIDSYLPEPKPQPELGSDESQALELYARDLGAIGARRLDLGTEEGNFETRLEKLWSAARQAELLPAELSLERFLPLFRVFRSNMTAMLRYVPRQRQGRVTLFRAAQQPENAGPDPWLGWGRTVEGEVEVRVVPGDHYSLLQDPQAAFLSGSLRACLDEAEEDKAWRVAA